jgi:cyanophycinase
MSSRSMALLGAGEFDPWSEVVDRWVLDRTRSGPVRILPTASAPEGDAIFEQWAGKGLAHFGSLGIPAEVLPVRTREDAMGEASVRAVAEASVVYFSGGNPKYLAETLVGTPLWGAIVEGLDDGLGYIGCSAGVASLTERTYDAATEDLEQILGAPGLAFTHGILFAPHWDTVDTFFPGATEFIASAVLPTEVLIALDESTAMLGDGAAWAVAGVSGIHVLRGGVWMHYAEGDAFELAITAGGPAAEVSLS